MGLLADRYGRKPIIVASLIVWVSRVSDCFHDEFLHSPWFPIGSGCWIRWPHIHFYHQHWRHLYGLARSHYTWPSVHRIWDGPNNPSPHIWTDNCDRLELPIPSILLSLPVAVLVYLFKKNLPILIRPKPMMQVKSWPIVWH